MSLSNIVSLSITVANPVITRAGFGTALILSAEADGKFSGLTKIYTSLSGLTTDGFSSTGATYQIAAKLLSQNPQAEQFKVGKRNVSAGYTQSIDLEVQASLTADIHSVDIDGTEYSYARPDGYTDAQVAIGLGDLIAADTELSVAVVDSTITVTSVASDIIHQFSSITRLNVTDNTTVTAGATGTDLDNIVEYDDDWYVLLLDLNSSDQIEEAAEWIETKRKTLFYDIADSDCLDSGSTTDIFSTMKDLSYANTVGMWHQDVGGAAAAGWVGIGITYEPGAFNYCHKTISGVSVSKLTDAQTAAIRAKRGNYYIDVAGSGGTWNGITPSGEFIDTINLVHFLYARITEDVVATLKANVRIPYTNAGIATITSVIEARLRSKIGSGIAGDPAPEVTAPLVTDINATDKQSRHVPDIKFAALLSGAINSVSITGTLSVDESVFA